MVAQISGYEAALSNCEVGAFLRATEAAMDAGRFWEAERHFRLVEELLAAAGPELRNALEVSYLEDLALGKCTRPGTRRSKSACLGRCGRCSSSITGRGDSQAP